MVEVVHRYATTVKDLDDVLLCVCWFTGYPDSRLCFRMYL
jgi:hypothetical protein